MKKITVMVNPSLALIKYWGKADDKLNLPATPSLAITLGGFYSKTSVEFSNQDEIKINDKIQNIDKFNQILEFFKHKINNSNTFFKIDSENNFPTAAGFASSSSGFAALVFSLNELCQTNLTLEEQSSIARIGSASAARCFWGGWTLLDKNSHQARQIYDENYWPELRLIALEVSSVQKSTTSRNAMTISKRTSPFYQSWVESSKDDLENIQKYLKEKNLSKMGETIRHSYLKMFGVMESSNPPIIFRQPLSLDIIKEVQKWRDDGLNVWETMDAGPQVKILCLENEIPEIQKLIQKKYTTLKYHILSIGEGPRIV